MQEAGGREGGLVAVCAQPSNDRTLTCLNIPIPNQMTTTNQVCGYEGFIKERFERCLDLYLCPRAFRKQPRVSDPDRCVVAYHTHRGRMREREDEG